MKLTNIEQWNEYSKSGFKPPDVPYHPERTYKKEWKDWADWFGYDDPTWSLRRVKELLTDLIRSRVIYEWDEAVLYSLLLRKGLLNLHENNRHRQFFKNLLGAVRTNEGRQLVENYVKSDSDIPPNLAISKSNQFENLEEIQPASLEELSQIVENVDPLEYGRFKNVEHILKQTDVLESINVDEEAIQFYLNYSIGELWKLAFENRMAEDETVKKLRLAGKNENIYHDRVVEAFLADYNGTRTIRLPEGYSFPMEPTLMQLFVAYKVKNLPYFGNFSATGAGKTLSAILASRVIDSKMTVIVCPNDVVDQWSRSILEVFPKSKVVTGKKCILFDILCKRASISGVELRQIQPARITESYLDSC